MPLRNPAAGHASADSWLEIVQMRLLLWGCQMVQSPMRQPHASFTRGGGGGEGGFAGIESHG